MTKEFKVFTKIINYLTLNPLPLVIINFLNNIFLLLYFLGITNFYFNFLYEFVNDSLIELYSNIEKTIIKVKNYNSEDFKSNGENSNNSPNNSPNNFNEKYYKDLNEDDKNKRKYKLPDDNIVLGGDDKEGIKTFDKEKFIKINKSVVKNFDEIKKPYPKIYMLGNKKIISKDSDNINNSEIFKRSAITKCINVLNQPIVDYNIRRAENLITAVNVINYVNVSATLAKNPSHFNDAMWETGIFKNLNSPISKELKIKGALVWVGAVELNDQYYENYCGVRRPHSAITQGVNNLSPLTESTFIEKDTWDESKQADDVIKEYAEKAQNELIKGLKQVKKIQQRCDVF